MGTLHFSVVVLVVNVSKGNKSERPVDALAVKKYQSPTDNLKSRDASASKNLKKFKGNIFRSAS